MLNYFLRKNYLYIKDVPSTKKKINKVLKILLIADSSHKAKVVMDHIDSIKRYSRNNVQIINSITDDPPLNLSKYDVIIIHYSIFILGSYFLSTKWEDKIINFKGIKIQIIQDEFRNIDQMKNKMKLFDFSAIFSSLNISNAKKVYNFKNTFVISCLPGYIHEEYLRLISPQIEVRKIDIIYRGRLLPPTLGNRAINKFRIGYLIEKEAIKRNYICDISSDERKRIYGDEWLKFLSSGKVTLGVEGGSTIFDFTGKIEKIFNDILISNPTISFDEAYKFVKNFQDNVVHQTITPRIFEAIATKTALILYPGNYSGLLIPNVHYLELNYDHSNVTEILDKIKDSSYLQKMVDFTRNDILFKKELSFEFFSKKINDLIEFLYIKKFTN
jgi:hypothetical protein